MDNQINYHLRDKRISYEYFSLLIDRETKAVTPPAWKRWKIITI